MIQVGLTLKRNSTFCPLGRGVYVRVHVCAERMAGRYESSLPPRLAPEGHISRGASCHVQERSTCFVVPRERKRCENIHMYLEPPSM